MERKVILTNKDLISRYSALSETEFNILVNLLLQKAHIECCIQEKLSKTPQRLVVSSADIELELPEIESTESEQVEFDDEDINF